LTTCIGPTNPRSSSWNSWRKSCGMPACSSSVHTEI
jgi:hypothetical protein